MIRKLFFLILLFLIMFACTPYFIKHNERLAGDEAEKFSKLAFIDKNFTEAYQYMPDEVNKNFTVENFKNFVEKMHPSGSYPAKITAEDYEIVPGKGKIKIFLEGSGAKQIHYYLLVMGGTEKSGYKVFEIYRNETPFPASSIRQPLN